MTGQSIAAALAITLAGVAITAVIWVAATTQGARWLLESVIPLSGISISAQKIEGRMVDHLLLTEVRVGLTQQKVEIGTLELRLKPILLLAGTVALQELLIKDLRIQDDTPRDNKPPILVWPKVPETGNLFDGRIARLQVTNVSYRRLQEQPVLVTHLSGSVAWQGSTLSITDLKAESTFGSINGSLAAGFNKPSLTANLVVDLAQPVAEMDRFSLQVGQSHDSAPEPLAGTVNISGSAGARKLLELKGDLGMAQNAFNLRRVTLNRPGRKGQLTADGSLLFTTADPVLTMQIKVAGLDLAPELSVPTDISGTLKFTGILNSYHGEFTLANQAQGWQAATVSAAYQGTTEGMKMAPLTGSILGGTLAGNLDMNWRDGFTIQGSINGRNLNPARIAPEWKGAANFNATGMLVRKGTSPVTGSVNVALLESRLHGQALTGELQANFANNNLSLSRLLLQGKGFNLTASGELNQRLTLTAQINDFSRLVSGSAGTLQAEGWLRWRDAALSGALAGTGSKLAYAGARIGAASMNVRLDQGTGHPLHVAASLKDLLYEGYTLNTATVEADGTLPQHSVNATIRSEGAEARLTLNGGYNTGLWKGEISRLSGRDKSGPWNLAAPATFSVSAEKIFLSPLVLTSAASERLEAAVDLALNPLSGKLRTKWTGVDLTRLNPWLPSGTRVEGRTSGNANGIMLPGKRFELEGNALLSGGILHQERADGELNVAFRSATASWDWREEALSGAISLTMSEQGQAHGTFQLPIPALLPVVVNSKGPLRASFAGQLQENGIITSLFPGVVQESSGVLDADVEIGGTWEVPQVGGKLRLTRAGAYLPTAGIHLKDLQLSARLEKNLILIDSFKALSGPGQIEGTALITLSGW
ncbi:MAG: hypothetical protein PHD54_12710, partial [Desulfuromonadaceae bacterium]|nr:hypothetical protein [Desulfuromonadaceae bacterium]